MLKRIFIYKSVMEKLPVTSYVRLVDIWLIFGQLIPFIEVTTLYICVSRCSSIKVNIPRAYI